MRFLPTWVILAIFWLGLGAFAGPFDPSAPIGNGDGVLHLGTNGYASLPDSQVQNFDCRTNFSVEVALNIEANAAGGRWPIILGKKSSPPLTDPGFALSIAQGQFRTVGQQVYAVVADGSRAASLSSRFFQGIVHAVMTWDAANGVLTLYMNGKVENCTTNVLLNTAGVQNSNDLKLGSASSGQALQRDILLARLWNRVLGPDEVTSEWNQFSSYGQHGLPAGFDTTALVSQWLMDATCGTNGTPGPSNLRDSQGANHLAIRGSASLWQGNGPLVLQFPPDGATNISKSVTLKAAGGLAVVGTNAAEPLQYQFQIDEANTFDSPALKDSGWLRCFGSWKPILKPSTQYFWRVRVQDSSPAPVASSFAASNSFTTKAASDWYVRPGVYVSFDGNTGAPIPSTGAYGAQGGTSYASAWNGIFSIVWGEGGVEPGDDLYICGTHCYTASNNAFIAYQGVDYISESGYSADYPITIRMDSPTDPGNFWGALCNNINGGPTWNGPDANGVYWSSNVLFSADYWANGTNIVLLNRETAPTWISDQGASFMTNGVWYVKTPDGGSPAGKICTSGLGYRFHLGRSSYIRFLNCRFRNAGPGMDVANYSPSNDTQTTLSLSCYITFDGCDLRYGSEITPTPGNDHWTIKNSELAFSQYGVYSVLNNRNAGANSLTVQSNYIHDMGTARFPNLDAHGVGVQAGNGHLVEGNRIEDTGTAIEFWTSFQPMCSNTICFNFIKNIHSIPGGSGGGGVAVSGDNTYSVAGVRAGFRIFGNIIMNTGLGGTLGWQGTGIGSGTKDFIFICNNTIYHARTGIGLSTMQDPAQAKIANNIIIDPISAYISIAGGVSSSNLLIDYNLFYPATGLTSQFVVSPVAPHDQHSVFASPMFLSATPSTAADFQLRTRSKAIKAGIPAGLTQDFAGNPIPATVPDIGAFQYSPLSIGLLPPDGLRVKGQ